jgi:hypothetical protein
MKKLILAAAIASLAASSANAQSTEWYQQCDRVSVASGAASCQGGGINTENWYARIFDVSDVQTSNADPAGPPACTTNPTPVSLLGMDLEITNVLFSVNNSTTAAGIRPIELTFRTVSGLNSPVDPTPTGDPSLILGTATHMLADTADTLEPVTLATPILIPAGTLFVQYDLMVHDGMGTDSFWPGSNQNGEFGESWLAAPSCGITVPVPASAIGFFAPLNWEITTVIGGPSPIGTNFCGPAIPNSTGVPALISALGSTSTAANNVTLSATQIPAGQFGYYITSETQAATPFIPGGSSGFVCISGNIGRYNGNVGMGPIITLTIDLTDMPTNPHQPVSPGEDWNFQCWHRDLGSTSNFTDGLNILFN